MASEWELVTRGTNHIIKGLELSPHTYLQGGETTGDRIQSPMTSDLINHAYVMKPP